MTTRTAKSVVDNNKKQEVVTKSVIRAADQFGVSGQNLGELLGLSAATISRLLSHNYMLNIKKKEFELGLEFVRLFRGVDAITGGDEKANKSWLMTYNTALKAIPLDLIKTVRGLVDTVAYVDTFRAKI